jgi:hypothetical protein
MREAYVDKVSGLPTVQDPVSRKVGRQVGKGGCHFLIPLLRTMRGFLGSELIKRERERETF